MKKFVVLLPALLASACALNAAGAPAVIVCPDDAPPQVRLAAKEVRRYLFLRTGELATLAKTASGATITFAEDKSLDAQAYRLKSDGRTLVISGGSPVAELYGAYAYIEKLGVRFQLDGDVLPDGKIPFALPVLDEKSAPAFALRGIVPFHDFNEGPDFWDADDYKAYFSQLAKMRMNFAGFHCYPLFKPWGHVPREPGVWVGLDGEFGADGKVTQAYPSSWATTARRSWGYVPMKTGDFSFGAAELFERDDFGAEVMTGLAPQPKDEAQSRELFDRVGALWKNVFTHARSLGVKTALGTEAPLIIPDEVAARLKAKGKNPDACAQEVYEAMFKRIEATHPLDYFWIWTPERGLDPAKTKLDFLAAVAAREKVAPSFKLAACGWGWIAHNFPMLDAALPKEMPFSCINDEVGCAPVSHAFGQLGSRERWAIAWAEDDTALTAPQLWAGRIRKDALDAKAQGCTGFMGIHWRTAVLAPNFAMLADCGWNGAPPDAAKNLRDLRRTPGWVAHRHVPARQCEVTDFYRTWCASQFGAGVAADAAAIFAKADGDLPRRAVDWLNDSLGGSPGCIAHPDTRPWSEAKAEYAYVDALEALRPRVTGTANRERFDYWLAQLRFQRGMGETCCALGDMEKRIQALNAAKDGAKKAALNEALASRRRALEAWRNMVTRLLESAKTPGELGTLTNLEQHSLHGHDMLTRHDATLEKALGAKLPAELKPDKTYAGRPRLFAPTVRPSVTKGETLAVKFLTLDRAPVKSVVVRWRPLGRGEWRTLSAAHVARGVWRAEFPAAAEDFEYFAEAQSAAGTALRWPATAPETNQTVVID